MTSYAEVDRVGIAANLIARTNISIGNNIYTQCMSDPSIALDGDLWFEPWPSTVFRVVVQYSSTVQDEVDVNGTPNAAGLSAVFLGATGEDLVGTGNQNSPNGTPDLHIQLRGLAGTPIRVQIIGDNTSGLWEAPYNGYNWTIATRYSKPAGWVEHCNSRAHYELIKDCVVRYNGLWGELVAGRIRSQKTLNERLKFYKLEQYPPGAPGITLP